MHSKEFVDYVIAFTPILISLLVAWIAGQQSRISKEKLRLDLYEKRFAVYENSLAFYQVLIGGKKLISSGSFPVLQNNFIKSYRESQFLFRDDSKIFELLGEIHTQSFQITGLAEVGKDIATDPDTLLKMSDKRDEALASLNKTIRELELALALYLNFHKALA